MSAQLGSAGPSGSGAAARSGGSAAGPQASAFGSCLPASSTASSWKESWICAATGGGGSIGGGGSAGGGGGGEGEEEDGEEYLDLQQAKEMAAAKGVSLPEDLAAAAAAGGLRRSVLEGYAKIMAGGWLTSRLAQALPAFRNRLIADKMFFFKVWAEVAIDSGGCRLLLCALRLLRALLRAACVMGVLHGLACQRAGLCFVHVGCCCACGGTVRTQHVVHTLAAPACQLVILIAPPHGPTAHTSPARPLACSPCAPPALCPVQAAPPWPSCASGATASGTSLSSTCQT